MAFRCQQITLVASTPTALITQNTGSVTDPLPVQIKNEDAAAIVWIGGSNVDATHGQSLGPGVSMTFNIYGTGEIPFAWSTGTPKISVLQGRV